MSDSLRLVDDGEKPPAITDDEYVLTQRMVEAVAGVLLTHQALERLDAFIERGQRAMDVGAILHPSEWMAGATQLQQVLVAARALRDARQQIQRALDV